MTRLDPTPIKKDGRRPCPRKASHRPPCTPRRLPRLVYCRRRSSKLQADLVIFVKRPSPELDAAVRSAYDRQPHAADRIFVVRKFREAFLRLVRHLLPEADETEVLEHLERCRKRGQANGGLPRKAR